MALDTVFAASKKGITDSELCVLKFPEYDKKTVFSIRKSAQDRVHAVIVLYQIARHCVEHENPTDGFVYAKGEHALTDQLVESKLFRLPLLGLAPWMLKFIFDDEYVKAICPIDVKFHSLFKLKPKDFEEIQNHVRRMHT
jgi:hypothetical protein